MKKEAKKDTDDTKHSKHSHQHKKKEKHEHINKHDHHIEQTQENSLGSKRNSVKKELKKPSKDEMKKKRA